MALTVKARSEVNINGARFYPIEKPGAVLWVPSVTAILEVWPKPALITWAAKSEKAGILGGLADWLRDDETASRGAMLDRLLALSDAPLCYREASRKAKDIGSSAHAWLDWHIKTLLHQSPGKEPVLLPGAERARDGAMAWMETVHFVPIDTERRVYDEVVGYAGRYDGKAEIDWESERRRVIVDWKASKGIYPDMVIQNAAYRQADALTANGGRSQGGVIVRLAKTEDDPVPFEAMMLPFDAHAFETFRAAKTFWAAWRKREGLWTGGYATDAEIAEMTKRKRRY